MPAPRKYPTEVRERAMRLVAEAREADPHLSLNSVAARVGRSVGIKPDTLRGWCRQAEIDAGKRQGVRTSDAEKIKNLEAEVRELKQAYAIQVTVSNHLARELNHAKSLATEIVDEHREAFGVAPMIDALAEHGFKIAPSTYYAARSRPLSARARRDAELIERIREVFFDPRRGRGVSGARRIWQWLNSDGVPVARCTVERLMRQEGLRGRPTSARTAS